MPAETARSRPFARRALQVVRFLFGLAFLVSGANGLFHLFPEPQPELPEGAVRFVEALLASGYMMPLIFGTQLVAGVLLVTNRFVPLALALLAPFLLNSLAFHLFLEPSGRLPALAFVAAELWLAWSYRSAFAPMLAARTAPMSRWIPAPSARD
jgi:uncharacterized membrane protein YphA (DoxX/SURF4 family)